MTKVICSTERCDTPLYFECAGHAGNKSVCAECSTLCSMLVRYIDKNGYAPKVCEDGHVKIEIDRPSMEMRAVFEAAMLEFKALAEQFREYIKVY